MQKTNFRKVFLLVFGVILVWSVSAQTGGGKTKAFFNIFESGTYHMKARMVASSMGDMTMETYSKDGKIATSTTSQGMSFRVVLKDDKAYTIIDAAKMIMVSPMQKGKDTGRIQTSGMKFTGSGTAEFNSKNLPYEEYSDSKGNKAQYFLDGSKLAGIRNIMGKEGVLDMIIDVLDQNVPANVFELPSGYKMQEKAN